MRFIRDFSKFRQLKINEALELIFIIPEQYETCN